MELTSMEKLVELFIARPFCIMSVGGWTSMIFGHEIFRTIENLMCEVENNVSESLMTVFAFDPWRNVEQ